MTQESGYSFFVSRRIEPLDTEDFLDFMSAVGQIAPPAMTKEQLTSFLATILSSYCGGRTDEEMDEVLEAAVDLALDNELAMALNLAVGPEDGIN